MSSHPSDPSHRHTNSSEWIAAIACIVIFGALAWLLGPGQTGEASASAEGPRSASGAARYVPVGMSWPRLKLDQEALRGAREEAARERGEVELDQPEVLALHEAVKALNDHQFVTAPIPSRSPEELNKALEVALGDAIVTVQLQDFMALGEPVFKKCGEGFAELQRAMRAGSVMLEEAMSDASYEAFPTYRQYCGNMLTELSSRSLINERGEWRDAQAEALASIFERYRWAYLVHVRLSPLEQLTGLERELFLRWRVESPDAFTLEQRRHFTRELFHYLPDYPQGLALAMLAYEEGDRPGAAEIVSRYRNQNPKNPVYQELYRAIEGELSAR